jgi:hypothetical protein
MGELRIFGVVGLEPVTLTETIESPKTPSDEIARDLRAALDDPETDDKTKARLRKALAAFAGN